MKSDMACCFKPMTCFTFHVPYITFSYGLKTNALFNKNKEVYANIEQHKINIIFSIN